MLKCILKTVGWTTIAIALALIFAGGVAPKLIGGQALTVLSGSMQPSLSAGDLIVITPVAAEEIRTGDVVTLMPLPDDPRLVTHRVIGLGSGPQGITVITKGDANDAADGAVPVEAVKGRLAYAVPFLGYVTDAVARSGARAWVPLAALVFLAVVLVPWRRLSGHREEVAPVTEA